MGTSLAAHFTRRAGTRKPTAEMLHGVSSPARHLNLDRTGAKLLFQIFTEREERKAIAVASNAPFSEWGKTFTEERLCSAIVDRLTFKGYLIETGADSYRLQSTLERNRS
ncbi:ATP-binding protein [Micromonospora sp. B11E3]|uniref:ATP-binding protein n=1 Tax=Micromonospora sp. B11E3 TaxID=3153562 RepID=UPI00325ED763